MRAQPSLRPELASVLRFLTARRQARVVRAVQPGGGVLSELVSGRGRQ